MKTILSTTDWVHLQEVFDEAVNLSGAERAEYLDGACRGTPGLRTRVDSLIAAIERETSVGVVVDAAANSTVEQSLPGVGGFLGHYQISGIIGRGGMGIVYRAVRADDEYRKEVAIKVATMGLLAPDLRQRFLAERQILANLDHPNIARLLDGGTTAEGIPYVVMELVEGLPIDTYCTSANLDRRQRIELMITVARSVDFAHRHLVVHRDLKPENVHVAADGVPKLLDFGIAKALNPEGTGTTATVDAARLMTPEYASPEQMLGQAITTATDVYQLGLLLYLLLTGRRPYQGGNKSMGELERNICETPPAKPGIDSDIDKILLQALEKDPRRRYSSAEAFAEDLERYLGGFPVEARTGSFWYRASKFVGRHKLAVAAAGLFTVLIVGFSIGMALLAKRLEQQRNQAQVQLKRSERVSQLLEDVFGGADPDTTQGKTVTARELLDKGTVEVGRTLDKEPEVQASLYATLGHIYDNLGVIDQADSLMKRSLAIRRRVYGEQSIETAEGLNDEAEMMIDKGQYAQAEAMAREALALRESLLGKNNTETAITLNFLGMAVSYQGRRQEGESLFRRAIDIWQQRVPQRTEHMLEPMNNLSLMLTARGDFAEAEATARQMLTASRSGWGEEAPLTAQALQLLGTILHSEGKYGEAESVLRESMAVRRKVFGPNNMSVADSEVNLANVLRGEGRYDEAEKLYLDVIEIQSAAIGPESERVSDGKHELGWLYLDRGENAKAEAAFREALAIHIKLIGKSGPDVAIGESSLARALVAEGKLAEAKEHLNSALAIEKKVEGDTSLDIASIDVALGQWQEASHQTREAEATLRDALSIDRAKLPANHPDIAMALEVLGGLLMKQGRNQEATPLLAEATTIRQKTLPAGSPRIRVTQKLLDQARS